MTKKINVYLDMDGTIADLYGQENWLEMLINEKDGAFINCEPLTTEKVLLALFPTDKYTVKVLSMTPKNASKEYCEKVINEKNAWLDKYFPNITKRHYLPYGDNKNLKNSVNAILIDDNAKIRENYKGLALNPADLW